ncbi:MAG: hypothetical protein COB23_00480 [Methylophaga sp.]|nr:MAG: hypothetical protein COB23_00480 [Methylophaga sp.]
MLKHLRQNFILSDSQLNLYILATLTGLLAGAVIIAFRLFIEHSQTALLNPSNKVAVSSTLLNTGHIIKGNCHGKRHYANF